MEKAVENNKDKNIKKKQIGRLIKRGFLIVLNAFLCCYLLYSISDSVIEFFKKTTENNTSIITINGLSEDASLNKYKEILDYNEDTKTFNTTKTLDYVYYGGYLNFRNTNDMFNSDGTYNVSSYNKYILRNLASEKAYSKNLEFNVGSYLNSGIYLFSEELVSGDYIIYPNEYKETTESKGAPLKIESETLINEVFYTPLINGQRKKIELKSKTESPCLILSIRVVVDRKGYDLSVLSNESDKKTIDSYLSGSNLSIKFINKTEDDKTNLISLFNAKSTITIVVDDGDDVKMSNYVNFENINKVSLIEEGYLKGLDNDLYVRELGGDIFLSGKGYSYKNGENAYLTPYIDGDYNGSMVVKIGSSCLTNISTILDYLVK